MNKFFIVTSGIAYLTENNGTSICMQDAKLFDSMIDAEIALWGSDLDLEYWYVKII